MKKETIDRRVEGLEIIGIRKARRRKGIPLNRGARKEIARIETFLTEWDIHRIGVRIFRGQTPEQVKLEKKAR